jgi:hypothetical protein
MKNQKVKTHNPHCTHKKTDGSAPIGMPSSRAQQDCMENSAGKKVQTFEAFQPLGTNLKMTCMRLLHASKPSPEYDANPQRPRPTICDFLCGGGL